MVSRPDRPGERRFVRKKAAFSVHSLRFNGVTAVDEELLRSVLATRQSSKLPWGRKRTFTRARFDADLKRIQAFYADRADIPTRGSPDSTSS